MKTAEKVRRSAFPTALFAVLSLSLFFAGESRGQVQTYPETTWVKVIFYDYHESLPPYSPTVNAGYGANPGDTDFVFYGGSCVNGNGAAQLMTGMVLDSLSPDRKPIPTPGAKSCTQNPIEATPPCACHMVNWWRVSASMNTANFNWYDTNCVFACDSGQPNPLPGNPFPGIRTGTPKNPVWYWAQKNGGGLVSWQGRLGEYIGPNYDSSNDHYSNVVVYDSIPFTRIGDSTKPIYSFTANATVHPGGHFPGDNTGGPGNPPIYGFFPLDNRAFCWNIAEPNYYQKETSGHNFGYAMEMHIKFQYQPIDTFTFTGDDDLWCFINGKLAVDLGGVKNAQTTTVSVSNLNTTLNLGLTAGQYYSFDLFYCERDPVGADIQITTNLFLIIPTSISLKNGVLGNLYDTLTAGDTLKPPISGQVLDQNGQRIPLASDSIQWTEIATTAAPGDQILIPKGNVFAAIPAPPNNRDTAVSFTATEALRTADIVATYTPTGGTAFSCTTFVYIKPNKDDHIVIESSPTPLTTSPNQNNPLGGPTEAFTMQPCQLHDTGYVVWRDTFNNFISFDPNVTWSIGLPVPADSNVVTVTPGNTALGEGIINEGSNSGTAYVIATDPATAKTNKVTVTTNDTLTYDSVRIEVFNPATGTYSTAGLNPLILASPASTTLYSAGQRPGQPNYDPPAAMGWFVSPNLSTTIPVPGGQQSSWAVTPTDTGHGYIGITYCAMRDSIPVVFGLGTPTIIGIYPQSGAVGPGNGEYPPAPGLATTVIAGVIDTLYAKLSFTLGGQTYTLPNTDPRNDSIIWTISPVEPGRDTLENATNYWGVFSSTRAWQYVTVTATYGHTNVAYSVYIRILPGAINRLVFLGNSTIPDSGNVVDTIVRPLTIPTTDSLYDAYAVLVDVYHNFVSYATAAKWSSTNIAYATVSADTPSVGEGTIRKTNSNVSGVMDSVIAYDTVNNVRDTLPVNFLGYYYTSIFIGNAQGTALAYDTVLVSSQSTLYAWGVPSNGQPPALVSVTWSNSPGLSLNPAAPSQVPGWTFTADSVGNGWIKITRPGLSGPLTDSIPCVFVPGTVSRLVLYRQPGPPSPSIIFPIYPAVDTIASETSDTIDAKVFDNNGNWLSLYEQYPLDTFISWSIVKVSGPAGSGADTVLATKRGNITSFTPHIAYCLYKITATFSENGVTVSDSAEIYVNPGAAAQLLIEASEIVPGTTASNLLIGDHPISPPDTLRFGATDSVQYVYAVLRDKDGNFVSMCPDVNWVPLNSNIVTAQPGPLSPQGQGQVNRALGAMTGTTKVFATDESNLNYYDSVNVALEAYSYKRILIVVNNTVADSLHSNDTLRIPSDQDTSLEVVAQLSDNSFTNVGSILANWAYLSNSGIANQSAADLHEWTFSPGKTGNGMIIASSGSAIPDTVCIIVLTGSPASVVLYDSMGPPSATVVPLPNPTTAIPIIAGRPFLMAAKVFDANGLYLAQYDLDTALYDPDFKWSAINPEGGNPNGYLNLGNVGVTQHFTDTVSNDSAYVIVQLPVTAGLTLKDTVLLHVSPDTATHMVLENNLVPSLHIPPNPPWDTLFIPKTSMTGSVYAILRDRFQNLVGYDTTITSVVVLDTPETSDTSVISVSLGNQHTGQVVVTRNPSVSAGTAWVVATDAKGLRDTCVVVSLNYGYQALRIVAPNDTGPHSPIPLVLTTDQDDTLYVQAQRTDTLQWVSIAATWQLSPGLAGISPPGQPASSFSIAPTDTGSGWIRVTLGDDSITTPDTMLVHFTAGAAEKATIQIITPASQLVAGQPIKAVVILQDAHGNTIDIPTISDLTSSGGGAYYADNLGPGGKLNPFIVVEGDTILLDHIS
ncbi:MAG: fibro-slime domain-containing protein, partial [Chitinispirillaceae bacterium]